jgi:CDP-paratose 2-epimerase
MGKVDQGVFSLWMLRHLRGGTLSYNGWGGHGKQVRDLLHVEDLADLVMLQIAELDRLDGTTFNVGGGRTCSLSLLETTALCEEISGRHLDIRPNPDTRVADIKWYVSNNAAVTEATGWSPRRGATEVMQDIHAWLGAHDDRLRALDV